MEKRLILISIPTTELYLKRMLTDALGVNVTDQIDKIFFVDIIEYIVELLLYNYSEKYDDASIEELLMSYGLEQGEVEVLLTDFKDHFNRRLGFSGVWLEKTSETIYDYEIRQIDDTIFDIYITVDGNSRRVGSRR